MDNLAVGSSTIAAPAKGDTKLEDVSCSAMLAEIGTCLREWKAARHEGQAVLTALSNALLLRTYVDKGGGGWAASSSSAVWGTLANAGATVSRVSVATEARARRLHEDLCALQDAMLAAATGIRLHAQDARRRCCGDVTESRGNAATSADHGANVAAAVGGGYRLIDVADAASEIAEMLLKEALVTATVAQGVLRCKDDREALTVYAAAWMMQPYIDSRRLKDLEVMVAGRSRA